MRGNPTRNGACMPATVDLESERLAAVLRNADPDGSRAHGALMATRDFLFARHRPGERLFAVEEDNFLEILVIHLRRRFDDVLDDGKHTEWSLGGSDVDYALWPASAAPQTHNSYVVYLDAGVDGDTLAWGIGKRADAICWV